MLLTLIIIVAVLAILSAYIPMDPKLKSLMIGLIVLAVVLALLSHFGIIRGVG